MKKISDTLYGAVWLVESPLHGDHNAVVVIKRIDMIKAARTLQWFSHADNPRQERWAIERIWQAGGHDNILHTHAVTVSHGCMSVMMDFCEGGDLLAVVHQAPLKRLTEDHALRLFRQVVAGVQFLHEIGIAHRDLSLENVPLRHSIPKICDFGLSVRTDCKCSEAVGKAYYMAPEVVTTKQYDPAIADLWSLGVMLFILLTGSPAFDCASAEDAAFIAFKKFGVQQIMEAWGVTGSISTTTIGLLEGLLQPDPVKRLTMAQVQDLFLLKLAM
ncbi:TPA: hypothetical protein N0F65_003814 [Lagenidium giganteum]|uniref:Protein kinase domain-containing protein n=1 Tax=Lagenidium giganteum TaxID=4803 RepID=A0AAV2YZH1_9STRA|nr:TPA: hypothetical protein N0F65_003814 [Lagenidium giganteum]